MSEGLHSMTGFGRAEASWQGARLRVEVRTLNGRYLDLKLRTPKELSDLEPTLREKVQTALRRGRADVSVDVDFNSGQQVQLNEGLAQGFSEAAARLRELGFEGELDLAAVLQLPGVLEPKRLDLESEGLRGAVATALEEALRQLVEVRRREGEALYREMVPRLRRLEELADQVEALSADFLPHWSQRLRRKIEELSASSPVDETRLAQEIIFYGERADVSEELARLRAHLRRFSELLENPPADGVGKNLDFLCQEMNREMNTIVSKSPLADASALAVEGKLEIEKIREQVQNVE